MPTLVDEVKCIGCGACVSVCPANPNVYEMVDKEGAKKSVIKNKDACIECGACITTCPVQAIKLVQE